VLLQLALEYYMLAAEALGGSVQVCLPACLP
jgi:hypothetical protein